MDAAEEVALMLEADVLAVLEGLLVQLRGGEETDDATVLLAGWMTALASDMLKEAVALLRSRQQRSLSFYDLRQFGTAIDAYRAEALRPFRHG
jgi:hypothetical protein